jgi:oligoendopeptidase F
MSKIKDKWDLSVLYKSVDDKKIEADLLSAENKYSIFVKKYKNNKSYLTNENDLFVALSDYEELLKIPVSRTYFFLHLSLDNDTNNKKVRAKSNLVLQRLSKLSNQVLFFEIELSKISAEFQKRFLESKKLSHFNYFLKRIFINSKYLLSEPEEKILSLKSLPARNLWVEAVKKLRSKQTIKYKGKVISVSVAESMVKELRTQKERMALHNLVMDKYCELSDIAESEINAIVTNKKIDDELRGYKRPYSSTIKNYENEEDTINQLVETVTNNFKIVHRFNKIKAKLLGVKKLSYADRNTSVGKVSKKVTYNDSYKILSKLFYSIDDKFGKILDDFVMSGRVDAYPKIGKVSGAYCSSDYGSPTFVLLNHTDSQRSLETFAHEMGHAIHSEFSKTLSPFYSQYSMSTAEVASTLFELFLFHENFEKLTDKEKVVALHDRIQDDISTIFRQIACFNFEVDMHDSIRQHGNVSTEDLAKMMNKHVKSYMGDIELTDKDGYFFIAWPHIRYFFYVYSYAFGQITSRVLYEKYKEDKNYIKEIIKFLSAGGSMSPEDIFKSIGLDLRSKDFWEKGVKSIESDVKLLEKLINR